MQTNILQTTGDKLTPGHTSKFKTPPSAGTGSMDPLTPQGFRSIKVQ